ncbi:MAG: hypothetical protein NZ528_02050 [Caldilineales bacterium]|nr:hypothetical protein [Caldilineales bacterium]MDW8317076.1 hypothetical protein [Anaerolineae bacterium]
MECYNCGYQLPADAERCPQCGQRFKPRPTDAPPEKSQGKPSLLQRIKQQLSGKG